MTVGSQIGFTPWISGSDNLEYSEATVTIRAKGWFTSTLLGNPAREKIVFTQLPHRRGSGDWLLHYTVGPRNNVNIEA